MLSHLLAVLPLLSAVIAAPSSGYEAAAGGSYDAGWSQGGGSYDASGGDWKAGQGEIVHQTTITQTADSAYYTPQHGSGSWGQITDLNSCLQVCHAKFGGGMAPPPPAESGAAEAPPSGTEPDAGPATHTIIVAPTQGVLRFVPFAVNAKPGDKLHYIWGAGPHSVTLSDGRNVCNKSTTAFAFDSGNLNATQTFEQTVEFNTTTPTFYYCKVGQHCTAGMFGLINPPLTNVSNDLTDQATKTSAPVGKSTAGSGGGSKCVGDSMGCWVERYAGGGSRQKQIYDGVKAKCANTPDAWNWGSKWDMSQWETTVVTKEVIIENVMYSRYMLSQNPTMLDPKTFPTDWKAPPDLNSFVVASNATAQTATYGPAGGASAAPSGASSAEVSGGGDTAAEGAQAGANGAGRMGVPLFTLLAIGVGLGMFI